MAGKGDKLRKAFDFNKYWTNFPTLSGEVVSSVKEVIKKDNKTTYVYK